MAKKTALVLDDRERSRQKVREPLEAKGYRVVGVDSVKAAKKKVLAAKKKGADFDLIVSDLDLGTTLFKKHRLFDGYVFASWCKRQGIKSKVVLQSSGFNPRRKVNFFLLKPLMHRARAKGILVKRKYAWLEKHKKPR